MSDKTAVVLIAVWSAIFLANLAFWGLIVWTIIKLVNHHAG